MKVATYTRISTDEERQPFSLEAQTDRLNAYIASQDAWRLVASFTDQVSGKTLNRPGLRQALAEAGLGRFDLLLVYRVDRLSRSVRGLAQILEDLEAAGFSFRSATEPFDTTTAAGRMMVRLLGVFAEFERESIVERTVAGLQKKASRGEWTGGQTPYGYTYDQERRLLVPVEDEVATVQQIFRRYASRRHGSAAISSWLNDRGVRTRRGGCWTPQRVIDVLRNPTYIGRLPYKGESFAASHDPVIDVEHFEAAQALLGERGERYPLRRGNPTDYLLTSKLRCSKSGRGFVGTASHGKGGAYRYYSCFTRQRHGTARCGQERIPAVPLEDGIITSLLQVLSNGDLMQEAKDLAEKEWAKRHPGRHRELEAIERKLRQAQGAVERYLRAFESGRLSEALCGQRLEQLQRDIASLEAARGQLQRELDLAPDAPPETLVAEAAGSLSRAITNGEPQVAKGLLSALIERIDVEGRQAIQPVFRLDGVRTASRWPPRRSLDQTPCSDRRNWLGSSGASSGNRT
jgi:site-specific DNA recombinase